MVDHVPASVIEATRASHQLGVFFRVGTNPPLNWWMGVGDIPAGIDGLDPAGTVYFGGGRLTDIPDLEVMINNIADTREFTLSGIDPEAAGLAMDTLPAVRGCDVTVAFTTLDDYFQPLTNPIPIWSATASHVNESYPPVVGAADPTASLSLVTEAGSMARSRPAQILWSSSHQQARFPGDRGCDNTAMLASGVEPEWPRF